MTGYRFDGGIRAWQRDDDSRFMYELGRTRRPVLSEWSPSTLIDVRLDEAFMRARGVRGDFDVVEVPTVCRWCDAPLPSDNPKPGRKPAYCDSICYQAAYYRRRRNQLPKGSDA